MGEALPSACDPRRGMVATRYAAWYQDALNRGRADSLWTPLYAKFLSTKTSAYTVYAHSGQI